MIKKANMSICLFKNARTDFIDIWKASCKKKMQQNAND